MRVALTGAAGLLGTALSPFLARGGHDVTRLVRTQPRAGEVGWDPGSAMLAGRLDGVEAVVHLAGENIAAGRWSAARKARIRTSRVDGTRHLARALAALEPPPRVFVGASAIGIYGDRADQLLDEQSPPGQGFLPDVCRDWEAAAEPLRRKGARVVHMRFGIVLAPDGGALARMLPPFRLGVGGPIGSGRQWWSWIALDDVLGAIGHALSEASLQGAVNVVAPGSVTNAEFARTLGRVLRRPAFAPLPAFVARLALGEMADALLLASAHVVPAKLEASGFRFRYPSLEGALRHLLGREAGS